MPSAENHCLTLMTSNIKWALSTGNHTAYAQFNYPSGLLDDYLIPSFVSSNLQLLPASSLPADDLHRKMEAIRIPSSSHHQTPVPRVLALAPVMLFHLCASLKDRPPAMPPLQHWHSCPLSHYSYQQKMLLFPQPKNKQKPLDPKTSLGYCPLLYSPLKS